MSSRVLEFIRQEEPRFRDVPDAELTRFIGTEAPQFLQDKDFAANFAVYGQMQANEADTAAVTGLTGERGRIKATVDAMQGAWSASAPDGQPVAKDSTGWEMAGSPQEQAQLRAFDAQWQMAREMGRGDLARQIEEQRRQFNAARGAGTVADLPDATHPLVTLPRLPAAQSLPGQVASGVANAAIGFAEGLTSPENLVLLPAGNSPAVQSFFGASMLGGVVPGVRQTVQAAQAGDVQGAVEAGAGTAVAGVLGAKLARGKGAAELLAEQIAAEIPRAQLPPLERVAAIERMAERPMPPNPSPADTQVVPKPSLDDAQAPGVPTSDFPLPAPPASRRWSESPIHDEIIAAGLYDSAEPAGFTPVDQAVAFGDRTRRPLDTFRTDQGVGETVPAEGETALDVMLRDRRQNKFREKAEVLRGRRDAWINQTLEQAGNRGTLEYVSTQRPDRSLIVSPVPGQPGRWRTTLFDAQGPMGHYEFDSREQAIRAVGGEHHTKQIAGPNYFRTGEYVLKRSRERYTGRSAERPLGNVSPDSGLAQAVPADEAFDVVGMGQRQQKVAKGTEAVAQRIVNAEDAFVEFAMRTAGLTREQAEVALVEYRKAKAIKIDPVGGQFSFTHGGFAEADVLRRAAGVAAAPETQAAGPAARTEPVPPESQANPGEVSPLVNPFDTSETSRRLTELQSVRPRPANKMFGTAGGTKEQRDAYDARVRQWNSDHRKAQKAHREMVEKSNEWIRAQKSLTKPADVRPAEPGEQPAPPDQAAPAMQGGMDNLRFTSEPVERKRAGKGRPLVTDAKDAKAKLIAELEKAVEAAPTEKDTENPRQKVTIEIPGDGTFTVWNTKEQLGELLKKARRLETGSSVPAKAPVARSPKMDVERVIEDARKVYGDRRAIDILRRQAQDESLAIEPRDRALMNEAAERLFNSLPEKRLKSELDILDRQIEAMTERRTEFSKTDFDRRLRQFKLERTDLAKKLDAALVESGQVPATPKASGGGTLASPQQSTLPRNIQPQPGAAPAGDVVSLADIRRYLAQSLDIPVRARGYGQRAFGIFKTKPEVIRLKALNDIPTLAHETGHYLHRLLFPGGGSTGPAAYGDFGLRFDAELNALGQRTSKPSYTADQVRMEGVAEHLREYLTDRAQALAKAPNFTAFLEAELQAKHPETWETLTRARTDLGRYINQTAYQKTLSAISFDPRLPEPDLNVRVGQWLNRAYTQWFNDLDPLNRTLAKLESFGLPRGQAKAVAESAVNYVGGWRGKAEHTLEFRQTDLAGTDIGPGLRPILLGKDLRKLSVYLVNKRALVKNRQGFQTGIDSQDAATVVRNLAPEFEPVRRQLEAFQKNNLRLLEEAGILSPDQIRQMEAANADYVPFHRVLERPGDPGTQVGGKAGKGFINTGTGVAKFKGSDLTIIDPLESIVKNTYVFRDLAERNRVGRLFVDAIEATQGGGRVADQILRKVQTTKVPHEEVLATLERAGFDVQALGLNAPGVDLAFKLYQAARNQRDPANGIFTVWNRGKEQRWQTDDADLYRALALSDGSDVAAMKGFVPAALRQVASLLRAGAVLTPEFIVRNPLRDQFSAGLYAKGGFIPFYDGARGLFHVLKRDDIYQAWQKSGGAHAHLTALDRPNLQQALAEVVKDPTALQQALAMANPLNVLKNLQQLTQIAEEATRVAAFDRARQAGLSDMEAANASKEATLNFSRGGSQGRALNRYVAFFNAGMQDLDLFLRKHDPRDPKQLARIATKGFLYITVPSLLTWWAGKDDDAIQNLPEWRKQFFWNLNVGRMLGGKDAVISLPKPFLLGQVYGSSVERALDFATKRDANAVNKWFGQMLGNMPFVPQNLLPTAVRPGVEWMANYSFFRDAPLENQGMQNLPVALRSAPNSSGVARGLASILPEKLGASPVKIDNTVRGVLGGLGKYGTDAVDWVMLKAKVGDVPAAPARTLAEWPVVRAFANSPYQASAYVERFYTALRDVEQNLNALRRSPELLDSADQQRWLKQHRDRLSYYTAPIGDGTRMTQLRKYADQLSDVNRAMGLVQRDRSMTPEAKRDRLLELAQIRDRVAEGAYKTLAPLDQVRFR